MLGFLIETALIAGLGVGVILVVKMLIGHGLKTWPAIGISFATAFVTLLAINMTIYASSPGHLPNSLAGLLIFLAGIPLLRASGRRDSVKRQELIAGLQRMLADPDLSADKKEWATLKLEEFSKLEGSK